MSPSTLREVCASAAAVTQVRWKLCSQQATRAPCRFVPERWGGRAARGERTEGVSTQQAKGALIRQAAAQGEEMQLASLHTSAAWPCYKSSVEGHL